MNELTIIKEKNVVDLNFIAEHELTDVLKIAEQKGNVVKDGVFVMNELKKRGWDCLSYAKDKPHVSEFYYDCGYKGSYNYSRLVKVFK